MNPANSPRFLPCVRPFAILMAGLVSLACSSFAQSSLSPQTVAGRADAWAQPFAAAGDFSGVLLLAQGNQVLVEKNYGKADSQLGSVNRSDTRFRVASVSKTFTAAAIELLIQSGKVKLTDTLSRYVDGIPNGETITIEQLLLHQSGVGVLQGADFARECLGNEQLLNRLRKAQALFVPGKSSAYSNEGYFLLSLVVERASGVSFADFLQTSIFGPLKMANSGLACRDVPGSRVAFGSVATGSENGPRALPFNEAALQGAGSVYSTGEDLLLWLRAVDTNPAFQVTKWKYPYGWGKRNYSSHPLIEQSGQLEGFNSHVAVYPAEHLYAIVLSNVQSGFANRIPKDLETVFFGGTPSRPPKVEAIILGDRSMRQYTGTYASKQIPYPQTIAIQDSQLAMHWADFPFWRELTMTAGDTFFLRSEYAEIHFQRDANGVVRQSNWTWPDGNSLTFARIEGEMKTPAPSPPESVSPQ